MATEALKVRAGDQLDQMILWESGQLSGDDTVLLFQDLIDSGIVWQLQGTYGRTAQALIDAGFCHYRQQ